MFRRASAESWNPRQRPDPGAGTGRVAQTILAAAAEVGADLIVLGAREDTNLPRTPLDMASHLLHLSRLPVLIVPKSAQTAAPAIHPDESSGLMSCLPGVVRQ
jgi:hypothetical protein